MSGITELEKLLELMAPELIQDEFVFCSVLGELSAYLELAPLATFKEAEGLTLVLLKKTAENAGLTFESVFRQITLSVHSSLDAVGLTAAVSNKLATNGISANIIAAYYHDHIFVQSEHAEQALKVLSEF